jgi:RimJ/RimL family protein N-acetyltransferase
MPVDSVATERLELVLQSRDEVLAYLEAMPADDRAEVSSDWLAKLEQAEHASPWIHGFAVRQRRDGDEVGRCGFKGPPDADGVVEIAYGIAPDHQGKGYATEVVVALAESVLKSELASTVRAHTLPSESASTSVLRKCGYQFVGEVDDPEDGPVWRWEYPVQPE